MENLQPILQALSDFWDITRGFLGFTWWFWLFLALFPTFRSAWLAWKQWEFLAKSKFIFLEMRVPREVMKGPKGMDQVLHAIHNLGNSPADWQDKYQSGEVPRPFTFEIVSFGGETHFYMRCFFKLKGLVEASFFAYYPDVEIAEVDDFMDRIPKNFAELESKGYDMFGTEMVLVRDSVYPLRTYVDFETPDEDKQFDPISTVLEVMSKLKPEEFIGVQINVSQANDWPKKWDAVVKELRKSTVKTEEGFNLLQMKSPRQTKVLEAVEENLSKPAFEASIRLIYFSPKTMFYDSFPRRGIIGAFNQYAAQDMNAFRQNFKMMTLTKLIKSPYIFPGTRMKMRKKRMLLNFQTRETPSETFIAWLLSNHWFNWYHSKTTEINTEVLATLYHPPTHLVLTAPHMQRIESRKGGPGAALPIYGDEKAIEKFQ